MAHADAKKQRRAEMLVVERRSIREELKAADPDIFTKVPALEDVVGREQEFSERIAALEDIEALATKAARYDAIETALLNGDLFSALQQLNGKHSSGSVGVLVDNFLPTLRVLSFEMYCRAIRPVLEDVLLTTHDYAMRAGDQNLEQAAHCLHRHLLAPEKDRQSTPAPRTAAPRDRKVH